MTFGLWILERFPTLWIATNRSIFSYLMHERIPSLIELIIVFAYLSKPFESGVKLLDFPPLRMVLIVPPLRVSFGSLTFRVVFYSSSEGLSSPSSDVADGSSLRASAVVDHVGIWLYLTLRSALWVVFQLRIGACLLRAVHRCGWSSTCERPPLRRSPSCRSPTSVLADARSLLIHTFY